MSEPDDPDQPPRVFPKISAVFRTGSRAEPAGRQAASKAATRSRRRLKAKRWVATGGAAAIGAAALAVFSQQLGGVPLLSEWMASRAEEMPHVYSFQDGTRLVRGESTSKFVSRAEYSARLEACDQITTDASAAVITTCYITLRPTGTLVVTNVLNATTGVFSDGRKASVCCMSVNNGKVNATSRFSAGFIGPMGTYQRSFEAGEDVQILMQIPSLQADLDAIYFSPGNQPTTVILPAAKYIERTHMTKAMVSRLGNVQLREFIADQQQFESDLRRNQQLHDQVFGPDHR